MKKCSHKNRYVDVYGTFIHDHQKLVKIEVSSNGKWKSEVWYIWNRILFFHKKKCITDTCTNRYESQMWKVNKSASKIMYYMIILYATEKVKVQGW